MSSVFSDNFGAYHLALLKLVLNHSMLLGKRVEDQVLLLCSVLWGFIHYVK